MLVGHGLNSELKFEIPMASDCNRNAISVVFKNNQEIDVCSKLLPCGR